MRPGGLGRSAQQPGLAGEWDRTTCGLSAGDRGLTSCHCAHSRGEGHGGAYACAQGRSGCGLPTVGMGLRTLLPSPSVLLPPVALHWLRCHGNAPPAPSAAAGIEETCALHCCWVGRGHLAVAVWGSWGEGSRVGSPKPAVSSLHTPPPPKGWAWLCSGCVGRGRRGWEMGS